MITTNERLRVGVIGDPVAHSISPAMQQPALDALGINALYERWHTSPEELEQRVQSLRSPEVIGANVTVPHKLAVMPHLDEVSDLARNVGAVNTIINRSGRLSGDNTDVHGFSTSLLDAVPNAAERTALILGAGGAARAVAIALHRLGVHRVAIYNRHPVRARQLAADLLPIALIPIGDDELAGELRTARIVINATSLGWHPGEIPIPAEMLDERPRDAIVVDLTYRDTDLLKQARSRGLATLDGLPMLVHQGARSLELWTGRAAPVEIMMSAALAEREKRS